MLDPSKCLNFVLGGDTSVTSAFDCMTVRSVSACPTPRRFRTRIRQPPDTHGFRQAIGLSAARTFGQPNQ